VSPSSRKPLFLKHFPSQNPDLGRLQVITSCRYSTFNGTAVISSTEFVVPLKFGCEHRNSRSDRRAPAESSLCAAFPPIISVGVSQMTLELGFWDYTRTC